MEPQSMMTGGNGISMREGVHARRPQRALRRADGLGWFSLALGLAELAIPRGLALGIGVPDDRRKRTAMRGVGLRELAAGIGILAQARATPWVWSRVVGDVMDLALLGRAFTSRRANRKRLAVATAAVLGVTILDAITARRLSQHRARMGAGSVTRGEIHVIRTITINRSPEEVYRFWRDLENLPRFMAHLESVEATNGRTHWRAKGPAGSTIEWDAEIVEDAPNERIVWRSVKGSTVPNAGSVRFAPAPGGRGTEIHVELLYRPPGRKIGAAVAMMFGEEPSMQIAGDLRRLKQVLETGEVVHSDASIHRGLHPAQPPVTFEKGDVQ